MSGRSWPWLSYLDGLRPDPGWQVDVAVLATYSTDCTSLVAAMLALAGRDDDRGSGSKVDFAEAFDHLKGRLHLLVQSGRIAVPHKRLPVLRLLDRFMIPVDADERVLSWHPKVALVRLSERETNSIEWRLWVSSRNLTRDRALDTGLLLLGRRTSSGARLKGIGEMGRRLFTRAACNPDALDGWCNELTRVAWLSPDGVVATDVRLMQPGDQRALPIVPADASEVIVISPFLDAAAVAQLGAAGRDDALRKLISTTNELQGLAERSPRAFDGYASLIQLESAPSQPGDAGHSEADAAQPIDTEDEWQASGLHAKVVLAKAGHSWLAWIGSANATERGWLRNHEVVVRLDCTQRVIDGMLEQINSLGRDFDAASVKSAEVAVDEDEERLNLNRARLLGGWAPRLLYSARDQALVIDAEPPLDADVVFEAGWLGGSRRAWPPGCQRLSLPHGIDEGDTELFEFCLQLNDLQTAWVQRIPWDAPLPSDRDERVVARFLDHRTFMAWLRDLLTGQSLTTGGSDWDEQRKPSRKAVSRHSPTISGWLPTLEEVLRATVQDAELLRTIDRKFRAYLSHLPDDIPAADLEALREFERVWRLVRRELLDVA